MVCQWSRRAGRGCCACTPSPRAQHDAVLDALRAGDAEAAAARTCQHIMDVQHLAGRYAAGPARVQFQNKNPRGWAEFAHALAGHSVRGSALTMRGMQASRPSLYALRDDLAKITAPVLILAGDEDEGCREPALMLKRTILSSGLAILPQTGHTANLEEPGVFNAAVDRFLAAVERGAGHRRDPRSLSSSTTGMS
jgi:pimeloyl-ACP methyl ester carboxylesterase